MKRIWHSILACVCLLSLVFVPTASADMRGVDVSNWQCDIDTYVLDADFVVAGATWGIGGFNNMCLTNGVNQSANYQLGRAMDNGKSIGVYHYAMGNDAVTEADFFVDNVAGYVGRALLALDWEADDNPQFGNGAWIETWVRRVYDRTKVWPVVYTGSYSLSQLTPYVREHCGVWVAQYASNVPTGYQTVPWLYGAYGEAMRQYTSNGEVPGYAGRLDLNYFRGARWQWDAYARGERDGGAPAPAPAPAPGPDTGCASMCVTVGPGDTLSGIAAATGLGSWSDWSGYASGDPSLIYPGETVCYGGAGAAQSGAAQSGAARAYTVQPGDSLWAVFGADWSRVASVNGLSNPSLIYPGQILYY